MDKEKNQQVILYQPEAYSQKLIQCLIKLDGADKSVAKMEFMEIGSNLMPKGKPDYLKVIHYPKISELEKNHSKKFMISILTLMVKDFCSTMNVVRNMNEDQMIEAGCMLLDECDNFRLEDYVMMFAMAKRGQLVKIYDRIDLEIISTIIDVYWEKRNQAAATKEREEIQMLDGLGPVTRNADSQNSQDKKLDNSMSGIAEGIAALKEGMKNNGFDLK